MLGIGRVTFRLLLATTWTLTACGAIRPTRNHTPAMADGVIVIEGEELAPARGNLLATLQDHIPGMRVDRTDACPQILLRSRKSTLGTNNPAIYVDGTRTVDTCILELLNPVDIARIEVYRNGLTGRPGYKAHPNGVILIFFRTGGD